MLRLIGEGRMGGSMARAARSGGLEVSIVGRGFDPQRLEGDEVLICVPDDSIAEVATRIGRASSPPRLVGHTSGATGLDAISTSGASDGLFSIHPLQTVPDSETLLDGAPAAIAASNPEASEFAEALASSLGLEPFAVSEAHRALYHAAASISSNFLIALEQTAAEAMTAAGVEQPRERLAPLIRRTVDNWVDRPNNATSAGLFVRDLPPVFRNGSYSCLLCREPLPDCCGKSYSRPDVSMTAVLPTVSIAEGLL